MKRVHLSTGIYQPLYMSGRRRRVKHTTKCDSICDFSKATPNPDRVTCRNCLRKMQRAARNP